MESPGETDRPDRSVTFEPSAGLPPAPTDDDILEEGALSPEPTALNDPFDAFYEGADIDYRLPLTLQYVDTTSVRVHFELSAAAAGTLYVRSMPDSNLGLMRIPFPEGVAHQLLVDSLQPGVEYELMVLLRADDEEVLPRFGGEAWGPITFSTPAEEDGLRIGVIGDASFGDEVSEALVARLAEEELDFVIHTGDVVDVLEYGLDPFEAYAEGYYGPFEPLLTRLPVYSIPGNHDYDADILFEDAPFYFRAFPAFDGVHRPEGALENAIAAYAFTQGGVRFLFLDSQVFYGARGREAQDTWMMEELTDPAARVIIPVFHIAPYSCSTVHPEDSLAVRTSWVHRFQAERVPLVLSGHYHGYERAEENGITYLISAGGSAVLYAQGPWLPQTRAAARESHVLIMEIAEDQIALEAIDVFGQVLDAVVLTLHASP